METYMYVVIVLLVILTFVPRHTLLWRWIIGTVKGLDCTLNCLLLLGDYRETISGRVGKAHRAGVSGSFIPYYLLNLLFYYIDGNSQHCNNSIDWAVGDKTIWRWRNGSQ